MTDDDATRPTNVPVEPEPPTAPPAAALDTASPYADGPMPADPMQPMVARAPGSGRGRGRWIVAGVIAAIAIGAAIAAVLLFGQQSAPVALQYIPGDAAVVMELRMDLPGDQMQALGNLLAHFPGFQDQSTLPEKIDEALSRLVAQVPGSSTDYRTDIKPLLDGPTFIGIRSIEDLASRRDPKNMVVVATTNGSATCGTTFQGQAFTTETYNGITLSLGGEGKLACAADGRYFLVGDPAGVKGAIDAHANGTGINKSVRYAAARAGLGLDRLATLYVDGAGLAKAMPSPDASNPLSDLTSALPEWVMAGLRAENDALVFDVVMAPAPNASPLPSMRTYPPVHPINLTALAPADSLAFVEAQGSTVGIHNLLLRLQAAPRVAEALKPLDSFGGANGLIDWIDDVGAVVIREGDAPAGAVFLVASDAATANQKATTVRTVLGLGALGGAIQVTESTVEGVAVTNIHIPDISTLLNGAVPGGTTGIPPIAVDLSIAVKDRILIVGYGNGVMARLLGVKAGASLAEDPAFKRALARSLPNPQSLVYVAAGSSLDWIEAAMAAAGAPAITADVKPYIDPIEGIVISATDDGTRLSTRIAITVTKP